MCFPLRLISIHALPHHTSMQVVACLRCIWLDYTKLLVKENNHVGWWIPLLFPSLTTCLEEKLWRSLLILLKALSSDLPATTQGTLMPLLMRNKHAIRVQLKIEHIHSSLTNVTLIAPHKYSVLASQHVNARSQRSLQYMVWLYCKAR